jgi:MFS transporter, ACS family, hexuronate transporter
MQKAIGFRWVIITLIFYITMVNFIDRSSISYAIPYIQRDLHLTDGVAGLILGVFGIGYAITTFLGGIAVDRFGTKKIFTITVCIWSVASMFTGLATGFMMLLIIRILLGVAEGPNFPALTRAISDWLPEGERVRALSLTIIAVPISLAVGGPIVSFLITHTSWRSMFFITGAISLLWVPLWLWLFRDFPEQSKYVSSKEDQVRIVL